MTLPTAITVAGAEPETAENKAQASNVAIARPPLKRPTNALAKLINLLATPPVVIKFAASTKNGNDNKGIMLIVCWKPTAKLKTSFVVKLKRTTILAIPSETAIGTLKAISVNNKMIKIIPLIFYYLTRSGSAWVAGSRDCKFPLKSWIKI